MTHTAVDIGRQCGRFHVSFRIRQLLLLLVLFAGIGWNVTALCATQSVFLEDLTWVEIRDAVASGKTTALIPVGGTEQSGPQIAVGKHNVRVHILAGKIAEALGNTLVAPVLAYVPEGSIDPPVGHMRFAGTISIPDDAFRAVLLGTARSLRVHGFTTILLIGDHGGYQNQLKAVAAQLNREWAHSHARALYVEEYYRASDIAFAEALKKKGLTDEQIGSHAGTSDTSLMLAIDPSMVRIDQIAQNPRDAHSLGAYGDARDSSASLGEIGVDLIVSRSVAQIRQAQATIATHP